MWIWKLAGTSKGECVTWVDYRESIWRSGYTRTGIYPARALCARPALSRASKASRARLPLRDLAPGMSLPIGHLVVLAAWRPCWSDLPGCDQAGV